MKKDFHLHFYTRIFFAVAILAAVLFLSQRSVQTEAVLISATPIPIYGWAYSPLGGWISLNCLNDINGDGIRENTCSSANGNYGLRVTESGGINYVQGCAWSGQSIGANPNNNLGYLCFSDPNPDPNIDPTLAPDGGIDVEELWNVLTDANGTPSFLKMEPYLPAHNNYLFPSISYFIGSSNPDLPSASNPIEGCFNCFFEEIKACSNNLDVPCTTDADCGGPTTCVRVGQNNKCQNCLEYTFNRGACSNNPSLPCDRDGDCGGGTCQNIKTCSNNRSLRCENASPDCDPRVCNDGYSVCDEDADCPRYDLCSDGNTNCPNGDSDCPVPYVCVHTIYTCPAVTCDSRPVGSVQITRGAFNCIDCTIASFDNTCDMNAYGYNRNTCRSCGLAVYDPGLVLDSQYNRATSSIKMCGWGYNNEIGWVWFSPRISTSTKPYISVEGGSIYSRGSVYSRYTPPVGRYNASYLIESGGNISNFISSSTLAGVFQGELKNRPLIDFFAPQGTKYRNVLGAIDYTGLITTYANDVNKYGSPVQILDDASELSAFANFINNEPVLGGKTYYLNNNSVIINADMQINATSGRLASGVFVVNGNLRLNNNVEYMTLPSIANLKEIPSLVWVVRGDVTIGSDVTSLAGTFVVLGNGSSCAGASPAAGCGQFITCGGGACDQPLVVDGSVLAKRFQLLRTYYSSAGGPSESFVNNGRLQANPPPGLIDFGQLLPRFVDR